MNNLDCRRASARHKLNHWETIADNLSEAGWSWAVSQRLILAGKRSGLQTHIAATERDSSSVPTKSSPRFSTSNIRCRSVSNGRGLHARLDNQCLSRTLKRIGNSNFRLSNTVYLFTLR